MDDRAEGGRDREGGRDEGGRDEGGRDPASGRDVDDQPPSDPAADRPSSADEPPPGPTPEPAPGPTPEPAPGPAESFWVPPAADAPPSPVVVGWNTGVQWEEIDRAAPPPPRGTLQVGSVFLRTIDLFLRQPLVFAALALPGAFISAFSARIYQVSVNPALSLLLLVATGIIGIAFSLALVSAADDARAGRPAAIGPAMRRGFGRTIVALLSWIAQFIVLFGILIAGSIVVGVLALTRSIPLIAIAFVALMALVFYVLLRWSLASTAIVLEPLGPVEAIGRSRAITRGNLWRIVGLYVLLAIVTLPVGLAVALLTFAATDPMPTFLLAGAAGLVTTPLFSIASTMILGDLTGRPEDTHPPVASPLRGVFAGALVVVGVVALVFALPKIGPAWERLALQGVPLENRGVIFAGTTRNPADQCKPNGVKTTFSTSEPIWVGGYFTKPVPPGRTGKVEIFVNGREAGSVPLSDRFRPVACYYELEPLLEAPPGTYRLVVSLDGELLAQGEFTVH